MAVPSQRGTIFLCGEIRNSGFVFRFTTYLLLRPVMNVKLIATPPLAVAGAFLPWGKSWSEFSNLWVCLRQRECRGNGNFWRREGGEWPTACRAHTHVTSAGNIVIILNGRVIEHVTTFVRRDAVFI